ncbi:hypothetical protein J6590_034179 [Homalodisca vitripennis]|nr:hypothetical protein J6590_034179 [Homalodisca vitripennis]
MSRQAGCNEYPRPVMFGHTETPCQAGCTVLVLTQARLFAITPQSVENSFCSDFCFTRISNLDGAKGGVKTASSARSGRTVRTDNNGAVPQSLRARADRRGRTSYRRVARLTCLPQLSIYYISYCCGTILWLRDGLNESVKHLVVLSSRMM